MKIMFGNPGTFSGFILRIIQCLCASASIGWMVSASGFSNYTTFWYKYIYIYILTYVCYILSLCIAKTGLVSYQLMMYVVFVVAI